MNASKIHVPDSLKNYNVEESYFLLVSIKNIETFFTKKITKTTYAARISTWEIEEKRSIKTNTEQQNDDVLFLIKQSSFLLFEEDILFMEAFENFIEERIHKSHFNKLIIEDLTAEINYLEPFLDENEYEDIKQENQANDVCIVRLMSMEEKNENLKKFFKREKKNAVDAWKAGNALHEEKGNLNFENFVKEQFGIDIQTANKYIDIYNSFDKKQILNIPISHVYPLLDIKDVHPRLMVLEIIQKMEDKIKITARNIKELVTLVEAKSQITHAEIQSEFDNILKCTSKNRNSNTTKPDIDERGIEINKTYFTEILEIFPYEPIDEQGLVGLFCLLFPHLRTFKFKFNKYNDVNFHKIERIQTSFPDSKLTLLHNSNRTSKELQICAEFEYQSKNFISHRHHKAPNCSRCTLLICWQNNITNLDSYRKNIHLPLILSLKDVLEKNRIICI